MDDRKQEPLSPMAQASRAMGLGLAWVASTGLFLWLGSLADARLGSRPVLTLIGAFVGAAAGFYSMYHQLVIAPRERAKRAQDERNDGGAGQRGS